MGGHGIETASITVSSLLADDILTASAKARRVAQPIILDIMFLVRLFGFCLLL